MTPIHKFLKRNVLEQALFWYVKSGRENLPGVSIAKHIEAFVRRCGLQVTALVSTTGSAIDRNNPDPRHIASLEAVFQRMQTEHIAMQREDGKVEPTMKDRLQDLRERLVKDRCDGVNEVISALTELIDG